MLTKEVDAMTRSVRASADEKEFVKWMRYPLDKTVTCLSVVESKMECLRAAIQFIEGYYLAHRGVPYIIGRETAVMVDQIGQEYGISLRTEDVYRIQEYNWRVEFLPSRPFDEELDDKYKRELEEDWRFVQETLHIDERSPLEMIKAPLRKMRDDLSSLDTLRENVLEYIFQDRFFESGIGLSCVVELESGMLWEMVTIEKGIGKTFYKRTTKDRIEWWFLPENARKISVDARCKPKGNYRDYRLCCNAPRFYDYETVCQAISVLRERERYLLQTEKEGIVPREEWEKVCHDSVALNDFIRRYRSAFHSTRPGEYK